MYKAARELTADYGILLGKSWFQPHFKILTLLCVNFPGETLYQNVIHY
jgi:hypothetical protein